MLDWIAEIVPNLMPVVLPIVFLESSYTVFIILDFPVLVSHYGLLCGN